MAIRAFFLYIWIINHYQSTKATVTNHYCVLFLSRCVHALQIISRTRGYECSCSSTIRAAALSYA